MSKQQQQQKAVKSRLTRIKEQCGVIKSVLQKISSLGVLQ